MSKIIILLLLIVGIVAGLYLVQHPQILKSRAVYIIDDNDTPLDPPGAYELQKGFQADIDDPKKIPSNKIYDLLEPNWVRIVYIADKKDVIAAIPANVKILMVFNFQATADLNKYSPPHNGYKGNFTGHWRAAEGEEKKQYKPYCETNVNHVGPCVDDPGP